VNEEKASLIHVPRLYNVFEIPKVKAVRATTALRSKVNIEELLKRVPRIKRTKTADKIVAKFELRRGAYLLFFPSGYIEVHAPSEDGIREVLLAFRDELFKHELIK
jgi:hypothetical protein